MTHDSNLTISSRPMFFSVLAALNASVISFFVLWSNADTAAVNRAEEHGFDPSQLLPYDIPFWFAAHASLLSLLALDVLTFLAWRRSRSQPESPR
ncbi:cell surface protein [Actinomyces oris]|uniref:Cell surface protein n=1 Tax=Actinomyces oris TaxID=544580 RepID=A0AAW9KY53_9ACTO|nr:cell surface protein [Actinomyces oris]MEA1305674.1 cell surface protein [Actinomyces oris]